MSDNGSSSKMVQFMVRRLSTASPAQLVRLVKNPIVQRVVVREVNKKLMKSLLDPRADSGYLPAVKEDRIAMAISIMESLRRAIRGKHMSDSYLHGMLLEGEVDFQLGVWRYRMNVPGNYFAITLNAEGWVDLDSRLENLPDPGSLEGLENDPRALGQMMRKIGREAGEELGDDFTEVVDRLESGQSPQDIEKAMPELAEDSGGLDDSGDF